MSHSLFQRPPPALVAALVAFLLATVVAASLIWRLEQYRVEQWRSRASATAGDHAFALQRNVEHAMSATQVLATLVRQGKGTVANFDEIAGPMLRHYPGVAELALVPGGVIRNVVPRAGNEKALGFDLLQDPVQRKEALLARDTGTLTLAGPLNLIQGGVGVVGRLPVFLDDDQGKRFFWGFTLVMMRVPAMLEAARVAELAEQGLAWELWRIHPDTGRKMIIAGSESAALVEPVVQPVHVPNAIWNLSVMPVNGWGDPLGLSLKAALGVVFSLLLGYMAKLLVEAKVHRKGLEALVAQRTAEVRLREADLNRAQAIARVGSWWLDLVTRQMHGSAETWRILGVSDGGTISYRDFLNIVHTDDREAVDRATRASLKGAPYDLEFRVLVGEATRWVHIGAELTFGADGKLSKALGTMQDITERKRAEEKIQAYVTQLETAFMSTVAVATTLSELRDPYTAGHERRVGEIAVAIGAELGFDEQRNEGLRVAGYLHDIGKITIPAEILAKPSRLSALEFQLIQVHPQASYDVLKDVKFPWPVAEIALQHHERMDGSGYPQGLKGEAILLDARIIAVADVVEAMSSHRPYRPGLGIEAALAEIARGRGSAYDTAVADACLRLFREKGYAVPA